MVAALRRHRALIGYLILTAGVLAALIRGEQINNKQTETLRTIICLAQKNTQTSRQRTPDEKKRIIAFYAEVLEAIPAKPCDEGDRK